MTEYKSVIQVGQAYTDPRTGLTGVAALIGFQQSGCIQVGIEQSSQKDGKVEIDHTFVDEDRLVPADGSPLPEQPAVYVSDVELGRNYRDKQTGLEGWASCIDFHESMPPRVTIRNLGTDKNTDTKVLKYHIIDDFLLVDVEMEQPVQQQQPPRRSPATAEVSPR